jgi:dCTP deaminase
MDAQGFGVLQGGDRRLILTDREIRLSIREDLIGIDPPPGPSAYSSTSLDLTLDATLREFTEEETGLDLVIDPAAPGYKFTRAISKVSNLKTIDSKDGYRLPARSLVLGWTKEQVHLKSKARIAARVEGKSSLARLGLAVHVTAPTIHAGFTGQIQLEIINHGPLPIRLRAGMSICQLIFEQTLGFPEVGYGGQFSGQLSS